MYLGTQQASAHSAPLPVPRREWSFACVHNRQLLGHALTCTNKAVHVVHVTHRCANRTARTARSCPRSAGDRPHTRLSASTHCSELIHRDRRSSCRARPELVGHRPYPSRTSLEATRCTGKAWIRVWPARHNDAARTTPPHMAAPAWHCHAALASRAARAPVTTTPAPPPPPLLANEVPLHDPLMRRATGGVSGPVAWRSQGVSPPGRQPLPRPAAWQRRHTSLSHAEPCFCRLRHLSFRSTLVRRGT